LPLNAMPHHSSPTWPSFIYKSNALKLGNIGDRISSDGNKISKFPALNPAHAILPAQHFSSAGRHEPGGSLTK
jgi:hypothetical protein